MLRLLTATALVALTTFAYADEATDMKHAIAVLQQQRNSAWDVAADAQISNAKLAADLADANKALAAMKGPKMDGDTSAPSTDNSEKKPDMKHPVGLPNPPKASVPVPDAPKSSPSP